MELYKQISSNKRRSVMMVAVVGLLLVALGFGISFVYDPAFASVGVVIAVVIAVTMAMTSYWYSDKLALAASGAHEVTPEQAPQLHNLVESMAIAAGIPKPRVYVIEDRAPNAFATGRNPDHAAVAFTTGILAMMNRDELEGVVAHELSHVRNYDILVNSMVIVMVGAIVLLADFAFRWMFWGRRRDTGGGGMVGLVIMVVGIILIVLSPILAKMMQYSVSRRREQLADATAVDLTRYPAGLRSALEKLAADTTIVRQRSRAIAHMWIESPLDTQEGHEGSRLNRLFMTHPPLSERIEALRRIEGAGHVG